MMKLSNITEAFKPQVLPPRSLVTAPASPASALSVAKTPQVSQSLHFHQHPIKKTILLDQSSQLTADTKSPKGLMQCRDLSQSFAPCRNFSKDDVIDVSNSCVLFPSMRAIFSQQWSCFLCDFAFQVGSAITRSTTSSRTARLSTNSRRVGVGFGVSLALSKRCRRKVDIALYIVQESVRSRLRINLYWVIDCPRVIPRSSEVMQRVGEGSVDGVQRLLSADRAIARDLIVHGTTLLHVVGKTSNLQVIRLLIQEDGDVNARDEDGDTSLHWVMARRGKYEVARLLIDNDANLANVANDARTPLHTFFNDTTKKVLLRDDWVEETIPDCQGMSIFHYVAWSSKSSSELLKRSVAYASTGLWAIDDSGRTCLHLAAERGNVDILGYLLERSNLTEIRRTDNEGRTTLHYAMQNKRLKTIDLLLANDGDLYAKDNSSRNVLHHAAR